MSIDQNLACLSPDVLGQLVRDELSPSEIHAIEQHVTQCDHCRRLLDVDRSDATWQHDLGSILPADGKRESSELFSHPDDDSLDSVLRLLGPTDDPNMLGRVAHYEVVGVIGRGGMGVVFKAFDAPLNRFVAIKMLLPHLAASGAARQRFAREGQAAAAVIDDHVLPIYNVDQWQGVPYLVTQYSSGVTLQKRIEQQGPLESKEVLRIGMQTARGLAAAAAQGLVHRDVKPSNILLDGNIDRAMLTDFGLARAADDASITRTGIITGTPQYMSPEQARGRNVDARSDLFSLGCVMYFVCTGRPPFRGDNSYAILRLITDDEPRPISEINPDIPQWLSGIIAKLMSKEAADRYESAEHVADLLEECLAHVQQPQSASLPDSVLPQPVTALASPSRQRSRTSRLIAAVALAGMVIFAGIFVVLELKKGTLTIKSNSESEIPIVIRQGSKEVKHLTVSRTGTSIRLQAGQYIVDIADDGTEFKIEGNKVTLNQGETWIATVIESADTKTLKQSHSDIASAHENDSHGNVAEASQEDRQYLVWEEDDKVRLSHWFAKSLKLDQETLQSVNELLKDTWKLFVACENANLVHTITPEGHHRFDISEAPRADGQLDNEFWVKLDSIVDGKQRELLHALSTMRGNGIGDDTWSDRPKAFPSILGWKSERYPIQMEIWQKGTWFHWNVSTRNNSTSHDGETLPPELMHYWVLGNEHQEAVRQMSIKQAAKSELPTYDRKDIRQWISEYRKQSSDQDSVNQTAVSKAFKAIAILREQPSSDLFILQEIDHLYDDIKNELNPEILDQTAAAIIKFAGKRHQKIAIEYLFRIADVRQMPSHAEELEWLGEGEKKLPFQDAIRSISRWDSELAAQIATEMTTSPRRILGSWIIMFSPDLSMGQSKPIEGWHLENAPTLTQAFANGLSDSNPAVRYYSLLLGLTARSANGDDELKRAELVEQISAMLRNETDVYVGSIAIELLADIDPGNETLQKTRMEWANSPDADKAGVAMRSFAAVPDRCSDDLIELLEDSDWGITTTPKTHEFQQEFTTCRSFAVAILGQCNEQEKVLAPILLRESKSKHNEVAKTARKAIAASREPIQGMSPMEEMIESMRVDPANDESN